MLKKTKSGLFIHDFPNIIIPGKHIPFDFNLQLLAETGGIVVIDAEEGDTSEFDSVVTDGDNTFIAQNGVVCHGSYSFQLDFDGTNEDCYGIDGLGATYNDIYGRCYFRFSSTFTLGAWERAILLGFRPEGWGYSTYSIALRNYTASTATPDRIEAQYPPSRTASHDSGLVADTWYRVEIRGVSHASTGGCQIWLATGDGEAVLIHDHLDEDTSAFDDIDTIWVGNGTDPAACNAPDDGNLYIDDVKVDTSPIGVYTDEGAGDDLATKFLQINGFKPIQMSGG